MFSRSKPNSLADLRDDFNTLIADVRGVLSAKELDSIPEIRGIRQRIDEGISTTRESARRALDQTKDAALAADEYARNEPWKIAGVALAAGLLIGALASRRD